jgi:hypothetical protein
MQIEPLTRIDQIKKGDLLLISDGRELTHAKVQRVKVSEHDGTEVIFNLRKEQVFQRRAVPRREIMGKGRAHCEDAF